MALQPLFIRGWKQLSAYLRIPMSSSVSDSKSMQYYPVCVVPPERHYESYCELKKDLKWFERSRAFFYEKYPEYRPKKDMFEKVRKRGMNSHILLPTSLDYSVLYRGQTGFYGRCLPSLYRQKLTDEEIFAEKVRIAEFRLFLEQFDITKRFEKMHLCVDYVGLAQHYGLKTGVLDLTSDVDVSFFFAMCDYDKDNDCYKPKAEDREYIGYIYAILTNEYTQDNQIEIFSDKINVIGLQPFGRPGFQKGFACHVGKEGVVSGYLYSFSYSKEDSQRIFNHFHCGDDLWCKDEAADVAKQIASTNILSSAAVRMASCMFGDRISVTKRMKCLRRMGFKIISRRKQPWVNVRRPLSEDEWLDFQKTILTRKLIVGEKHYPCLSTQEIGSQMMFNCMYGSVDSPKDYDSGISFMEDKELSVWGICNSMDHAPLMPDEKDKKIHALWYEKGKESPRTRSFKMPDSFKPQLAIVKRP